MQRQTIIFLLLIESVYAYHALALQEHVVNGKATQVTCKVWTWNTFRPHADNPTAIRVSLDNISSEDVTISAMTGHLRAKDNANSGILHRGGETYWSPVDVVKKSALKPVSDLRGGFTYPVGELPIKKESHMEFTLELSALDWNKDVSSSLPSSNLFAVVPDGPYELYFDLEANDAAGRFNIESNKTSIEIRRERSKKQH